MSVELSSRGARMVESLPSYYWGNDFVERLMQGAASVIDHFADHAERIRDGLIPTNATDDFGLLGIWERTLKLPIEPPDATPEQRRAKVLATLQAIGSSSAASTIATLRTAANTPDIQVLRNTPGMREDTLVMPFAPGSYNAVQVEKIAERMWPAHRILHVQYVDGFLFDESPFDLGSFG